MPQLTSELRYVGSLLQKVRQEKGLSQGDVARVVGIERNNLSKIERNVRKPGRRLLTEICNALGYHPVLLLTTLKET